MTPFSLRNGICKTQDKITAWRGLTLTIVWPDNLHKGAKI